MKQSAFFNNYILAVKQGLILAIPFLMLGSFALVFNSIPLPFYQNWITGFAGGRLSEFFSLIYQVTLGSLAIVLTITISCSYGQIIHKELTVFYVLTAFSSYLSFTGFPLITTDNIFAAEWVFSAMCITLFSCSLFKRLNRFSRRFKAFHTVGGDYYFNLSLPMVFSCALTVIGFGLAGELLVALIGNRNILNFGSYLFLGLFSRVGNNLLAVLLYIFFAHILWFFGIHGTNTLEAVSTRLFEQNIVLNQELLAAGSQPVYIYSKTFLDVFVFIGGCGSALCLILALLLVSRTSPNRKLAKLSAVPVFFNINEPVIFGFPVIFNPTMLIPFVCTPLVMALISAAAMKLGLVPLAVHSVGWTVPAPFSGMAATGSITGSLLQFFNIVIGVCIYVPFVKANEKKQIEISRRDIHLLEESAKTAEQEGRISTFLNESYERKNIAKTLIMDITHTLDKGQIQLYYQPQLHDDETLHGAEALLRWKHPLADFIYPPLIIMLAREGGVLDRLGFYIIEEACRNMETLWNQFHRSYHISVNICPDQLDNPGFISQVETIVRQYSYGDMVLVFEFTEQIALDSTPAVREKLRQLQSMGILISMDDFGMGHGSVMYLNDSSFDEVKLDGSLIRQLTENQRSREIVQTISRLSDSLHFEVVAEYVETAEQVALLRDYGCDIYQGYYYSKALPFSEFLEYAESRREHDT